LIFSFIILYSFDGYRGLGLHPFLQLCFALLCFALQRGDFAICIVIVFLTVNLSLRKPRTC